MRTWNRHYPLLAGGFLCALAGAKGRPNLALLTLASFKVARILAHEKIGACVRDPLSCREDELCRALAELTRCTRCCGMWAALGLTVASESEYGEALIRVLAVAGANDWLQVSFARLTK